MEEIIKKNIETENLQLLPLNSYSCNYLCSLEVYRTMFPILNFTYSCPNNIYKKLKKKNQYYRETFEYIHRCNMIKDNPEELPLMRSDLSIDRVICKKTGGIKGKIYANFNENSGEWNIRVWINEEDNKEGYAIEAFQCLLNAMKKKKFL